MSCSICNKPLWHGSQEPDARPGTYLSEMGCHGGVAMDDDVYHEGYEPNVIYPPCPQSPHKCASCKGSGIAPESVVDRDDCPDCDGNGWAGGKCQWPDDRYAS